MPAPGASADALEVRAHVARPGGFALDVDVALPGHGVTAVFGPSGCGKTTLLRVIAGLTRPAPGRIVVAGVPWQDDAAGTWLAPYRRPVGFVFQDARLFEHLSVRRNLEFGRARVPAAERRVALDQAVELLGIGPLLAREPLGLSGGERQRVAIARAVATSPRLLLLDEPLAALDAARKAEVLPWFERMTRELDIPVLYVTHAPAEVARLAQYLLLLQAGRVVAQGPAAELMARPDLPLAQAEGAAALIEGVVSGLDAAFGLLTVRFAGGELQCVPGARAAPRTPGERVRLAVAARDVSIALEAPAASSILNVLPARVRSVSPEPGAGGAQCLVALDAGGAALLARITRKSAQLLRLAPGQRVFAQVKAAAVLD